MVVREFSKFLLESNNSPKDIKLSYFAFDWDDNLLHMPTVIHMDKKDGNGWTPVDISTSEFAKHRGDHENWRIRNNDPSQAFCEFRDFGPRGPSAFIMDTKQALKEGLFAPSWDSFLKCLSDGSIFCIITARGHEPESIRKSIEYVIDNILHKIPSKNPGRTLADEMYQNILKYMYYFKEMSKSPNELSGQPSKSEVIKKYLDQCDFYGITSTYFSNEFGGGNMMFGSENPEKAKEIALKAFIDKCNGFGRRLNDHLRKNLVNYKVKAVSIGFSDDDRRNVEHVKKCFGEHEMLFDDEHEVKLNVFDTSDRSIKGGIQSKYRKLSESNQSVTDIIPNSTMSLQRMPAGLGQEDILNFKTFSKNLIGKITKPTLDKVSKRKKNVETSESKKSFKKLSKKVSKQQKMSIKNASDILAASISKSLVKKTHKPKKSKD